MCLNRWVDQVSDFGCLEAFIVNQRKIGALLSYIGLTVNAIVSFVYVPLLLCFVSVDEYGVYELIGSIVAYLSVMDAGLSTTLTRFYVSEKAKSSSSSQANLLAMSAIVYLLLTALAVTISILIDTAIDPLLANSFTHSELALAHDMMRLVIVNCAIVLPGNWFLAILNAEERFVFARSLSIVKYVLQIIVVVAFLSRVPSVLVLLAVQVFFNFVAIIAYMMYVFKYIKPHIKLYKWDWSLARQIFAFSFFILLNMVFDQVFWKTGQLVLGITCGAEMVALYGISCKLITAGFMQVSTGVTSVFLPKLTAITAKTTDMREINNLFCRIGRIQAILVWGVVAAFAVIGYRFILLWTDAKMGDAYYVVLILMIGLSVSLIENLGVSVLQAKNKMAFRSIIYIGLAMIDLVVSVPVSREYGAIGCALVAAAILLIGTGPIMNYYYYHKIGIDIPSFFKKVLPLMIPAFVTALVVKLADCAMPPDWGWGGFAFLCLLFCVVYACILWQFFLNEYERNSFRLWVKKRN